MPKEGNNQKKKRKEKKRKEKRCRNTWKKKLVIIFNRIRHLEAHKPSIFFLHQPFHHHPTPHHSIHLTLKEEAGEREGGWPAEEKGRGFHKDMSSAAAAARQELADVSYDAVAAYIPSMQLASVQRDQDFHVERLPDEYYQRLHDNRTVEAGDDSVEVMRIQQSELEKKEKTIAALEDDLHQQKRRVAQAAKAAVRELSSHVAANLDVLKFKLLGALDVFRSAEEAAAVAELGKAVAWHDSAASARVQKEVYGDKGVGPRRARVDSLFRCAYEELRLRVAVTRSHYVTQGGERVLDYKTLWTQQNGALEALRIRCAALESENAAATHANATLEGSCDRAADEMRRVRQQYASELLLKSQRIRELDRKLTAAAHGHVAKKIPKLTEYGETDVPSESESEPEEDDGPSQLELVSKELDLCKKRVIEKANQASALQRELAASRAHVAELRAELEEKWRLEVEGSSGEGGEEEEDEEEEAEGEETEEVDDSETAAGSVSASSAAGSSAAAAAAAAGSGSDGGSDGSRAAAVEVLRGQLAEKDLMVEELELQVQDLSYKLQQACEEGLDSEGGGGGGGGGGDGVGGGAALSGGGGSVRSGASASEAGSSAGMDGGTSAGDGDQPGSGAVLEEENRVLRDKVASLLDELAALTKQVARLEASASETDRDKERVRQQEKHEEMEDAIHMLEIKCERLQHEVDSQPPPSIRSALVAFKIGVKKTADGGRRKSVLLTRSGSQASNLSHSGLGPRHLSVTSKKLSASDGSTSAEAAAAAAAAAEAAEAAVSEMTEDGDGEGDDEEEFDLQGIIDENQRLKRCLDNQRMTLEDSRSNLRLLKEAQRALVAEYRVFKERHLGCTAAEGEGGADPNGSIDRLLSGVRGVAGATTQDILRRIVVDDALLMNAAGAERLPIPQLVLEAIASGRVSGDFLLHFLTDEQLEELNAEARAHKLMAFLQADDGVGAAGAGVGVGGGAGGLEGLLSSLGSLGATQDPNELLTISDPDAAVCVEGGGGGLADAAAAEAKAKASPPLPPAPVAPPSPSAQEEQDAEAEAVAAAAASSATPPPTPPAPGGCGGSTSGEGVADMESPQAETSTADVVADAAISRAASEAASVAVAAASGDGPAAAPASVDAAAADASVAEEAGNTRGASDAEAGAPEGVGEGDAAAAAAAGPETSAAAERLALPDVVTPEFVHSVLALPLADVVARSPEFATFLATVPPQLVQTLAQHWSLGPAASSPLLVKTVTACFTEAAKAKREKAAAAAQAAAPADDDEEAEEEEGDEGASAGMLSTLKERLRAKKTNITLLSMHAQKQRVVGRERAARQAEAARHPGAAAGGAEQQQPSGVRRFAGLPAMDMRHKATTATLSAEKKRQLVTAMQREYEGFEGAIEHLDLVELAALIKLELNELIGITSDYKAFTRALHAAGGNRDEKDLLVARTDREVLLQKFKMYRTLQTYASMALYKLERRKDNILRHRGEKLSKVLDAIQHMSVTHPKESRRLLAIARGGGGGAEAHEFPGGEMLASATLFRVEGGGGGQPPLPLPPSNAASKKLTPLPARGASGRSGSARGRPQRRPESGGGFFMKRATYAVGHTATPAQFLSSVCGSVKPSFVRPTSAATSKSGVSSRARSLVL